MRDLEIVPTEEEEKCMRAGAEKTRQLFANLSGAL